MGSSDDKPPLLAYCELVANPTQYDEQVVRVRASHVTGFEWSFLTDEKCSSKALDGEAHTWIVIPGDATLCENASQVSTALPPQHNRSESIERQVVVMGVFHNSNMGIGESEYPFDIDFSCLEQAGKWQVVP